MSKSRKTQERKATWIELFSLSKYVSGFNKSPVVDAFDLESCEWTIKHDKIFIGFFESTRNLYLGHKARGGTVRVYFDVTALRVIDANPQRLYTQGLFRSLKGYMGDVVPIRRRGGGKVTRRIQAQISYPPKRLYPFWCPRGSILHGPAGRMASEHPKFKKVLSVNDLSFFHPKLMDAEAAQRRQRVLKYELKKGVDAVILPSDFMENEFKTLFPNFRGQIHRIFPGCDHLFEEAGVSQRAITTSPYFVFSSFLDRKSNILGVIKAFQALCEFEDHLNLVIVGDGGELTSKVKKLVAQDPKASQRIHLVGHKTPGQRKKIYAQALGAVQPNLYAGFPYSALEALKMGLPLITSSLGSMQELCGEGAHYVDPREPEQIMAAMERIAMDKIYREKCVKESQGVAESFTWIKAAQELSQVYQEL